MQRVFGAIVLSLQVLESCVQVPVYASDSYGEMVQNEEPSDWKEIRRKPVNFGLLEWKLQEQAEKSTRTPENSLRAALYGPYRNHGSGQLHHAIRQILSDFKVTRKQSARGAERKTAAEKTEQTFVSQSASRNETSQSHASGRMERTPSKMNPESDSVSILKQKTRDWIVQEENGLAVRIIEETENGQPETTHENQNLDRMENAGKIQSPVSEIPPDTVSPVTEIVAKEIIEEPVWEEQAVEIITIETTTALPAASVESEEKLDQEAENTQGQTIKEQEVSSFLTEPADSGNSPQEEWIVLGLSDSKKHEDSNSVPDQAEDISGSAWCLNLDAVGYDFLNPDTEKLLEQIREGRQSLKYEGSYDEVQKALDEVVSCYCGSSQTVTYTIDLCSPDKVVKIADEWLSWLKQKVQDADQGWKQYLDQVREVCLDLQNLDSEKQRLDYINEWVCTHFQYEVTNKGMPDFIRNKKGQCWHYAKIFTDLARASGSTAELHTTPAHSVSYVKVDGTWYTFDPSFNATCGDITAFSWQNS